MIVTTCGTISVATYTQNSASRPGKRRRANAYAANTENTSCPIRITATTCAVTTMGTTKSYRSPNSSAKLERVGGSGGVSTGSLANCSGDLNAVWTLSRNGASVATA